MNTKLTLRMDDSLVRRAKSEAKKRGKSVSQMVGEYFENLDASAEREEKMPPITASLIGVLEDKAASESDYQKHLEQKHR